MRVPIARRIIRILFTLLIMLNANLATKVLVSATSSTRPSSEQQSGNASANQEIATTVDERPLSPRLAMLRDQLKSGDRKALDSFWKEIGDVIHIDRGLNYMGLSTDWQKMGYVLRQVKRMLQGDLSKPSRT